MDDLSVVTELKGLPEVGRSVDELKELYSPPERVVIVMSRDVRCVDVVRFSCARRAGDTQAEVAVVPASPIQT